MGQILAGRKPVMEALKAGTALQEIIFLQGVRGGPIEEIRRLADKMSVKITEAGKQRFRQLAVDATTQGVVAILPSRQLVDLNQMLDLPRTRSEPGLIVICDQIEDPHNLGAVIRTAECAGVHGVVIPKHHAAPLTAAVAKASAGAIEHMHLAEVTNIVNTLERLKEEGYWIVGLAVDGEKTYTEVDFTLPTGIVVGNEGRGIRRLVREHCDHLVRIPLYGRITSLNASVSGALAMYEAVRQRHNLVTHKPLHQNSEALTQE
jgi:23S rRNA (guanosine2251-2'-O)-methyltransferase